MSEREDLFLTGPAYVWAVTLAAAAAYLKRVSAYLIQMIRWPLGPLLMFVTWRITYDIAGRGHVDGAAVSGFLLVGIVGYITWTSSIWSSGYTLEDERSEGTSGALFLSPASRAAVIAGYGLGSFVWFLPSFAMLILLGLVTGARLDVSNPLVPVAAVAALAVSSLAMGFALAGLFILSRYGNLVANVIQSPMYLLGGLLVPLAALPAALQPVSNALPVTHAILALRESALLGAGWGEAGPQILWTLGISGCCWLVGMLILRRVEYVAKRHGQLDLY